MRDVVVRERMALDLDAVTVELPERGLRIVILNEREREVSDNLVEFPRAASSAASG